MRDIIRLETIAIKLEIVPKEKKNAILNDMEWLTLELRRAWLELEKNAPRDGNREAR